MTRSDAYSVLNVLNKEDNYGFSITPTGIYYTMGVKKVIYNNPATIVYFTDGSKSVVKLHPDDTFDETTGLLMAISKRLLGSKGLHRALKDFTENYK